MNKEEKTFMEKVEKISNDVEKKIKDSSKVIEEKMDEYAGQFTKQMRDSKLEEQTKDFGRKVDKVGEKIEGVAEEIAHLLPNTGATSASNGIQIKAQFQENISRLFIFRFLWLIVQIPVIYIWSIWICIIGIIQFFSMLILGRRNRNLRNKILRFKIHMTKWQAYL